MAHARLSIEASGTLSRPSIAGKVEDFQIITSDKGTLADQEKPPTGRRKYSEYDVQLSISRLGADSNNELRPME
jgi:hypothetical protein